MFKPSQSFGYLQSTLGINTKYTLCISTYYLLLVQKDLFKIINKVKDDWTWYSVDAIYIKCQIGIFEDLE